MISSDSGNKPRKNDCGPIDAIFDTICRNAKRGIYQSVQLLNIDDGLIVILRSCGLLVVHAKYIRAEILNSNQALPHQAKSPRPQRSQQDIPFDLRSVPALLQETRRDHLQET